MQLHLVAVPFENLWLHYSQSHSLSLDLDVLYDKVVDRTMGGYCTEVNSFFAAILRGLGYTLIHGGGRVSDATAGQPGGGFQAWSVAPCDVPAHTDVNVLCLGRRRRRAVCWLTRGPAGTTRSTS